MSDTKKQSYLKGAAILAATAIVAKIISALFKIPLFSMLDDNAAGYYQVAYNVYMLFAVVTAGIPVALSRLVSSANATGDRKLIKRYFSISLPAFSIFGLILSILIFVFSDQLALAMNNPSAAAGIRVLSPAVFAGCVIAVYRGYAQGYSNMVPTAVSQILEVVCKAVVGLLLAWYLISNGFDNKTVSAGAISGVPIGLALGIPALIYFKRKIDRGLPAVSGSGECVESRFSVLVRLFKVSIPITLGSVLISLMTNIDTAVVNNRLVSGAGFPSAEAEALYGIYAKGLTLLNVSSALIVPLTVSMIPAIAAAIANNRPQEASDITQSSLKLTNIIAMPAAIGVAVLSYPIYTVLFGNNAIGPQLLTVFGIASYFVCMQLMTTAILQANGLEKLPVLSYPLGGLAQIIVDYFLTGNRDINIVGSPFGTLVCYLTIAGVNFIFILWKIKSRPNYAKAFFKPVFCTLVMGAAARMIFELFHKIGAESLGSGRLALAAYMGIAIVLAAIIYGILIIVTRTITRDDMKFVPKGEKIAKLLKIK